MSQDCFRPSAYGGGLLLSSVLHNSAECASIVQATRVWFRSATETTVDKKKLRVPEYRQRTRARLRRKRDLLFRTFFSFFINKYVKKKKIL